MCKDPNLKLKLVKEWTPLDWSQRVLEIASGCNSVPVVVCEPLVVGVDVTACSACCGATSKIPAIN